MERVLKIDESKIDRVLKRFESEQQIEQQMSRKCRLITVKNWSVYQKSEPQSEQQLSTNKEIKNTERRKKSVKPIASPGSAEGEKKKRETQPHFALIEYFFQLKEWEMDYRVAKRFLRAGRDVLEMCNGDVELAKSKILRVKEWADLKILDWSLETVLKRWLELDSATSTVPKKPFIEGCPAYQKGDEWYVINPDGSHAKWVGSLSALKYA